MKQRFARFGGAIILATAMAACSGTNSIPVASGPATTPQLNVAPAKAVLADGKYHGMVEITAADREMASRLMPAGVPHIMGTAYNHKSVPNAAPVGFPLDMTCQTTACPVMPSSKAYNIYVTLDGKTCKTESCWGNPEEFLKALAGSTFAGIAQQYTKGAASAYTFGGSLSVHLNHPYSNTLYNEDLFTVLAAAAHKFGAVGLTSQYHLFLPPGTDTCFDQYAICYSPDNLKSEVFCAYHSAVLYNVGGKATPIVFSVEPYQNVQIEYNGAKAYLCQNSTVPKGTNRLNSGTASTLSHESFEAWSDPEPNTGWFNPYYGEEIGDVCAYRFMDHQPTGKWWIQQEYSNTYHGCASTP